MANAAELGILSPSGTSKIGGSGRQLKKKIKDRAKNKNILAMCTPFLQSAIFWRIGEGVRRGGKKCRGRPTYSKKGQML